MIVCSWENFFFLMKPWKGKKNKRKEKEKKEYEISSNE